MTVQYGRQLSLIVADNTGKGIELGSLRVYFRIQRGDIQTPNTAEIKVYNLSPNTAKLIGEKEFTQVAIQAGYGQLGLIFYGSIKQVRDGRDDPLDSYVEISAADGDEVYNYSSISLTLAKGTPPTNAAQALIWQMAKMAGANGQPLVSQGYVPQLSRSGSVRGRTYYGLTRDELRDFAAANDCIWSIQDGKVVLIPQTSYIPGDAVVISPTTGLLNVPEQTENGLAMQVLLNPQIRIGRLVKLDSSAVNQYKYGLDFGSQSVNPLLAESTAKLNADGLYYVMRADHTGDTRADTWWTDLTCLAVDATVPLDQAPYAAIQPSGSIARH